MKKMGLWLMAAVLAVAGCGGQPEEAAQPETKAKVVEVYTIGQEKEAAALSLTGLVEARQDLALSFGASGKIAGILVKKGDRVKPGQVLATLDTGYYEKALEAAAGQVQEAAARRQKAIQGAKPEEIQQQRLQVQSAEKRYAKASQDLAQGEKLYAGGAIAKSTLDDLRLQKEQAEITLQNERIKLEDMLAGSDPDELAATDASFKQAASEAERARKNLGDTKIVAPFSGVVVDVTREAGELSGPGQEVIHLVDLAAVKVTLDVTSDQVDHFREGAQVTVRKNNGQETNGTVIYVAPVVDRQTGKYRVEVQVSNDQGDWRGGMVASVETPLRTTGQLIPLESLGISEAKRYVMVVENGVVKRREVEVGQIIGDMVEILSGVKAGDQLLKTGITYFVDGEKVVAKGE